MSVLIAIPGAILLYCLIIMAFGKRIESEELVQRRLENLSKEASMPYAAKDDEMNKPFRVRVLMPLLKKLSRVFFTLIPVKRNENTGEKLKKTLQQAGWTITPDEYVAMQLILMGSCALIGFGAGFALHVDLLHKLMYFLGGAFGAYAVMRYYCAATVTKRKNAMEKQLPDMLDLLSVSVAAGLGFERAMLHIIETMEGPLIDEFTVTYREMSMGRSRKDALTLLGERCGLEDLSSVTSAIVQAGQLGIPIRNVLQSQAAAIRRERRSKVQEKAAKVSTKILLPMVGLIFPVLFIVLLGPSVITIMHQFG